MIDVADVKKKMLDYLKTNGPSLPITLASHVGLEPVFASAILSELSSYNDVLLSAMKVGSSRIYYVKGTEKGLEIFADKYLSGLEKRAYDLLKDNKFLKDETQEPAIRVALRSLKDFAVPFRLGEKIMWRYAFVPKEEIARLVEEKSSVSVKEKPKDVISKVVSNLIESSQKEDYVNKDHLPKEIKSEKELENKIKEKPARVLEEQSSIPREEKTQKSLFKSSLDDSNKESKEQTQFSKDVHKYLNKRSITFLEEIDETRNEYNALISINSDLGKMNFFLVVRNKKTINDGDVLAAHQKSSERKIPCYFLHEGKLTKRAEEVLEQYKNLIKVDML